MFEISFQKDVASGTYRSEKSALSAASRQNTLLDSYC